MQNRRISTTVKLNLTQPALHECCAFDRRHTHNISGDPDFDFAIEHSRNVDLPKRLSIYLKRYENVYGPRTSYAGYSGYSGDE
jgi:hypothetical protein